MDKMSFFEKLTGSVKIVEQETPQNNVFAGEVKAKRDVVQELSEPEEGQLTLDMWQNPDEIVVQTIVGGVKPEDLDVSISHDMVTIRGKREKSKEVTDKDHFYQELYWGTFSRSILLPQEVDSDESEATIKNGLLTIRLPKLDKAKIQKLKVKNE
ncbi:MAG TPA: Hsp20/alpha crystallin family protein [Candidatus Paceibacterota bacterium]